ncbi:squalene synthase [Trichoderma reesei QM6a]|uniref:Squalene synthase n=2 Tax=Hypocrea jecorina TaxID=51453 RepID=G0RNH0_HYPJQ|nr:squalene synthase [Trichoderma reesei QM6a]EGR47283.1 squalene synthase [Trichoderma reesei QM6a]ETS00586.1 farnesyl-diphosphate farnesyltransferase [Trichoderma reesei RUT C-30]
MGAIYYLMHPRELRSIVQWKLWHEPVNRRDPKTESATLQECFRFLNMTSRSFSAVIQELNHELLVPVTLFYLVLRGLDTIEDDMTIPLSTKVPMLREFHVTMDQDGWQYHDSKEKDRELLEHFDCVITELKKLKKPYYDIIKDMTFKMGNGMADYAQNTEMIQNGVQTIEEYELYCHYVAGLVGEGLTRLLVASNLANPKLGERPELTESMGQFLQKTNIIRDIHEDWEDGRRWYPKEIWSKHVERWEDLFDPKYRTQAVECISDMVLDALKHVEDCLFYMAGMRDQSAFNFVAIPQAMAIATLELCFRNPAVLERNVKITKGDACQIMLESTQNLQVLCEVFRRYARRIQKKNDPRDPNFLAISARCAKIEQFIETLFPRQDPKKLVQEARAKQTQEPTMSTSETAIMIGVVLAVLLTMTGLMVGIAWFMGARFDNTFSDTAKLFSSSAGSAGSPTSITGRDEL